MFKIILGLIPVKTLTKYLPDILAYILTKIIGHLLIRYPHKSAKVKETAKEITAAMVNAINAAEDGVITKEELNKQKELWKAVFE